VVIGAKGKIMMNNKDKGHINLVSGTILKKPLRSGLLFLSLVVLSLTGACTSHNGTPAPTGLPVPTAPLTAPENLTLQPSGPQQVTLSWSTTSTEQDQFVISRSENGGEYAQIGIVDGAERQYVDDAVATQTSYTYQLYAEDATRTSDSIYSDAYTHHYFDACLSNPPAPDATAVIFYDIPVSGLTYRTSTTYAVTDDTGSFNWDQTGDVNFSIGYIDIGVLHSGDKVGLQSIALNWGGYTARVRNNLLRLFIALDEDSDTTNGIQLPCDLSLAYGEIDPTLTYDSFAQQETVIRLIGSTPLPTANEADARLYQYMFQDYVGHYNLDWAVLLGGIFPFHSNIAFDIDEYGNVINTSSLITYKHIDPFNNYRLRITDASEFLFASMGLSYYKLEVYANILPDQTIQGTVTLESYLGDDEDGIAWGGRL